jgi:hypothetical protein
MCNTGMEDEGPNHVALLSQVARDGIQHPGARAESGKVLWTES